MLLGLYRTATRLAGPLIDAGLRRRVRRGREDPLRLAERLGRPGLPRPGGPLVWLHAASVGESLAALPLIDALLGTSSSLRVLVTTGTVTSAGLLAQRLPERALHQFVPVDRPDAWGRFLDHWRPDLALLVESELWPNLVLETRARGVPLGLVNARMSDRSFRRWRRVPGTIADLLGSFALCLAQSEADARRLRDLGAREVRAPGNLKRAAPPLPADPAALAGLGTWLGNRPVWLAASTHPGEEELVAEAHGRLAADLPALLTIIAPRHPERGDAIAEALREPWAVAQRSRGEAPGPHVGLYVADTLGELGLFYRVAQTALIGGSLVPHGGQNPLEAARLGCPPLFGPHTANFREITATLEAQGAGRRVADVDALVGAVRELLTDPGRRAAVSARARAAAESERQVLDATLEALAPLLERTLRAGDAPA